MTDLFTGNSLGVGVDPLTSQSIFRAILNAFARPGIPQSLPASTYPAAMLPALALTDLETGTHLIEESQGTWASVLSVATGAPATALDTAKFVTALRPLTDREFGAVAVGTPLSPESGATVILSVDALSGGRQVVIEGPGIASPIEFAPRGISADFWNVRRRLVSDFPTGADLLFVSADGELVGIPRTTVVHAVDHNNPTPNVDHSTPTPHLDHHTPTAKAN